MLEKVNKTLWIEKGIAEALAHYDGLELRTDKIIKFKFYGDSFEIDFAAGRVFKNDREVKGRSKGYGYVAVKDDVCTAMIGIHRLVLIAYDPKEFLDRLDREQETIACHRNNDYYDNRLSNLEWGTNEINHFHGWFCKRVKEYYPDVVRVEPRKRGNKHEDVCILREGLDNSIIGALKKERDNWIKEGLRHKEAEFFENCMRIITELKK